MARLVDLRQTDKERYGEASLSPSRRPSSQRIGPTFSISNKSIPLGNRDVNKTRSAQVRLKLRSHEVNIKDGKSNQRHEFEVTHMRVGNPTLRRFRGA